jgi:poly [ADP-ribose] polymerase
MAKTIKLVMVAVGDGASSGANQNNKYYDMFDTEDGNFRAEYGRIGVTKQEVIFPMGKWQATYNSKIKKGYKDVTSLYVEDSTSSIGFADIPDLMVSNIISRLQAYANHQVTTNYNVSSEKVTQKQINEAQSILNELTAFTNTLSDKSEIEKANKVFLNLYSVIPRKMANVRIHLLDSSDEKRFNRMLTDEQDLLDTMAGQVKQAVLVKENTDDKLTLLDALGLQILPVKPEESDLIKTKLQDCSNRFVNAFGVVNKKTQKKFDDYVAKADNKKTELFWHGSRNENWMSILESGLVLRPTSAVISGKMFGYGTYFADKAQKSLGYTSSRGSYWARGNSDECYMSLYNVHLGNPLHIKNHQSWCYQLTEQNLKARGNYDSLFAEGGADLRNNEYIVYHEDQSTVKYLVQLKG